MSSPSFEKFFKQIIGDPPRSWQANFAQQTNCCNRFVPVGTGMGKTIGLAGAWFYHRIVCGREDWPRRLVWCLPMRVLVEQTLEEFEKLCSRFANNYKGEQEKSVPFVHAFLGGLEPGAAISSDSSWHLHPERNAILVGTQDMLISRALGRGYAAGRARWPIDFGLLNSDCLWVFDEVQLMGVSAVTGSQLQAFREFANSDKHSKLIRPSYSWWSSATLRPRWLETVDSQAVIEKAASNPAVVSDVDKKIPVFSASKPLQIRTIPSKLKEAAQSIADEAIKLHGASHESVGAVTLVVVNRVEMAIEVEKHIRKSLPKNSKIDVRLIHSRFRGRERELWRSKTDGVGFLSKEACLDSSTKRIIVSTQIIEAGVDISAGSNDLNRGGLVTELAPWSSLVQRFGRAARYGGAANVVVVDRNLDKKDAAPYSEDQLAAAREALKLLSDVGLSALSKFEETFATNAELDERLFRLDYKHVLNESEFLELFDTSLSVTGDDIDISRFIRETDDNNVSVSWIEIGEETNYSWQPPAKFSPRRSDVCPVPFLKAREWLLEPKHSARHRQIRQIYAFVWDYEKGSWRPMRRREDLLPGAELLVDHRIGGYTSQAGFCGVDSNSNVQDPIPFDKISSLVIKATDNSDRSQNSESLNVTDEFQSIADHGREVGDRAEGLARVLGLSESMTKICRLAGYWHDWGKSHPAFQGNIFERSEAWLNARDIAKAPKKSWRHPHNRDFNWPEKSLPRLFSKTRCGKRDGFRHELATTLGILELMARFDSRHPALLGPDTELDQWFDKPSFENRPDEAIVKDLVALSVSEFDLLLYLICSHHGKVRCQLLMTEADHDFILPPVHPNDAKDDSHYDETSLPVRGVFTGDRLPPTEIFIDGKTRQVPAVMLFTGICEMGWNERHGASWSERTSRTINQLGVFNLSLLESILRAADVLCSQSRGAGISYADVPEPIEGTDDLNAENTDRSASEDSLISPKEVDREVQQ